LVSNVATIESVTTSF